MLITATAGLPIALFLGPSWNSVKAMAESFALSFGQSGTDLTEIQEQITFTRLFAGCSNRA
jgi:hypothetical protein